MLYVFFFNDTATTEIYTLSLHDALPISVLIECEEMAFTELKLYIDIGLCITALYHILSVSVTTTLILLTVLTLTLYTKSIHQHSFSPISLLEVANFKNS